MLARLRGSGRTSARHREAQADRVARRRIRVLSDDEHPHPVERESEGAQHIRAGRQIPVARGELGPQELAHLGDLGADGFKCARPAFVDEFIQRTCGHERST